MLPEEDIKCHRTGFKKSCRDMVVKCKCRLWIGIPVTDLDSKKEFMQWDCGDTWNVFLGKENSQMQSQTVSSVDSLRNVISTAGNQIAHLMIEDSKPKEIEVKDHEDDRSSSR